MLEDGKHELLQPLIFESALGGEIIVPAGFVTDFSSVPRLPLAYWLTGNTSHRSAVIHDYLYHTGTVSREMADRIFLEAMKSRNVPAWRRSSMYWAVRLFGYNSYSES